MGRLGVGQWLLRVPESVVLYNPEPTSKTVHSLDKTIIIYEILFTESDFITCHPLQRNEGLGDHIFDFAQLVK